MDSISEKNCLEEISHSVFDENEKITLKAISNNWSVTNKIAQDVLCKWLSNNKNKEFHKEFVVKGTDKNDNNYIMIVPESVKNKLEKKWKNFSSWLFSVEVKSESRKLNLPDHNEIKIKNLRLNVESRNIKIHSPVVPEVKKEAPVKKNIATTSTAIKKEPEPKTIPKPVEPKVSEKEKPVEVKKETITPKKSSPEEHKKSPAKGKAGIKNMKPVGKGSIASFFNAKPGTANTKPSEVKKAPEPVAKKESPEPPKKTPEIKKEKTTPIAASKKRVLEVDKDEIPNTPEETTTKSKKNEKKKLKFKSNSNNKRSRIMQLESSSESEQEEMDEPEKKLIKFDRELTPEPAISKESDVEMEQEPEPKVQPIKSENGVKKRVKAKKMVTKTYEDEDGFIKTVREMEEYSTSEDEVMCIPNENEKPNQKKSSQSTATTTKKTPNKKVAPAAAKSTGNSKTKQGSIMSFFSKK